MQMCENGRMQLSGGVIDRIQCNDYVSQEIGHDQPPKGLLMSPSRNELHTVQTCKTTS